MKGNVIECEYYVRVEMLFFFFGYNVFKNANSPILEVPFKILSGLPSTQQPRMSTRDSVGSFVNRFTERPQEEFKEPLLDT